MDCFYPCTHQLGEPQGCPEDRAGLRRAAEGRQHCPSVLGRHGVPPAPASVGCPAKGSIRKAVRSPAGLRVLKLARPTTPSMGQASAPHTVDARVERPQEARRSPPSLTRCWRTDPGSRGCTRPLFRVCPMSCHCAEGHTVLACGPGCRSRDALGDAGVTLGTDRTSF